MPKRIESGQPGDKRDAQESPTAYAFRRILRGIRLATRRNEREKKPDGSNSKEDKIDPKSKDVA